MKILLVGTYPVDQQYSLLGFANTLREKITEAGHEVCLVTPHVTFGRFRIPRVGNFLGHVDKFVLFPHALKQAATRADVVHFVDHGQAVYTKYVQRIPHVVTCNDLIAAKAAFGELPEWRLPQKARIYQQMILEGLWRARHVVCISEATRQDVIRMAKIPPIKTSLVYDALFHDYHPLPSPQSLALLQEIGIVPGTQYLIHVGRDVPTKNREGLLRIFQALRAQRRWADLKLVLAGKPLSEEMRQFVREQKLAEAVLERSHLQNEHLRALYSSARALVFPSLCEGFGLPIIEAQACGCPVFTSDRAPMTEVGGDAAVYFDPTQPEHAAQVITEHLDKADQMRESGFQNIQRFTTEKMIDGYLRVYRQVLNERCT